MNSHGARLTRGLQSSTCMLSHLHTALPLCCWAVLPSHLSAIESMLCRPNIITEDLDKMGVKKKRGTSQGQQR